MFEDICKIYKNFMNEDFAPFELAVKLKEKGFPQVKENTLAMYDVDGEWFPLAKTLDDYEYAFEDFDDRDCVCPTISQVLKWLREEKKIHIIVEISDSGWYYTLYPNVRWENGKLKSDTYIMSFKHKASYEQAALAGIEYVLDNLI